MSLSQLHNRIHIGWMTIKMHRDNGLRVWSNSSLDCGDVDRIRILIDVHQNWRCSGMRNCQCRSYKAICRGDDLIARSDLVCAKSQLQSRSAGVHTDRKFCLAERSELLFE